MLFTHDILQGIADGRVTLALRRWRRAPPADGSTLRTAVGVIALHRVRVIDDGDITPDDIRRTGMTAEAVRRSIRGEGTLLRIELRLAGADPRVALRDRHPDRAELADIRARLARLDRASPAAWTRDYLRLIADHPAVVSHRLSPRVGESDPVRFKRRVRQLKELGLTESLGVGYRLSPRGAAVLAALA
jgi:hypothetical protein